MKNIRIDNIEFRKTSYENSPYEFVKWEPNQYYNKESSLLKEGYEDTGYSFKRSNISINYSCFENPETCYVVAWFKRDSEGWFIESVGDRLLDLNKKELKNFFEIYRIANKKLNKQLWDGE